MAYTPTEWQVGDVITAEKLNKLEQAVAELSVTSGGNAHTNDTAVFTTITASNDSVYLDKTAGELYADYLDGLRIVVQGEDGGELFFFEVVGVEFSESNGYAFIAEFGSFLADSSSDYPTIAVKGGLNNELRTYSMVAR